MYQTHIVFIDLRINVEQVRQIYPIFLSRSADSKLNTKLLCSSLRRNPENEVCHN